MCIRDSSSLASTTASGPSASSACGTGGGDRTRGVRAGRSLPSGQGIAGARSAGFRQRRAIAAIGCDGR
eukprot:2018985-Alexandrium_andersonii.AAC.1